LSQQHASGGQHNDKCRKYFNPSLHRASSSDRFPYVLNGYEKSTKRMALGDGPLGAHPRFSHHDGRWRKIKVSVTPPIDRPALAAHAPTGYYSPRD
jgi:hypothetical protein